MSTIQPTTLMPTLLTTQQTADYVGVSVYTLQRWRSDRAPWRPPAVRIGARKIMYRRQDLDLWLESRMEAA